MKELLIYKDIINERRAHPPIYTTLDYKRYSLTQFGKFDAIWIDPPLLEYVDRVKPSPNFKLHPDILKKLQPWDFEDIRNLPIKELAESQCFVFMWIGSGEYLEKGRDLLKHWGFRRCEDIVWVKTTKEHKTLNSNNANDTQDTVIYDQPQRLFKRHKEHCLVGIKGTVRRIEDTHLIHTNIDTDVIIGKLSYYHYFRR